jgi:hypothetical protein
MRWCFPSIKLLYIFCARWQFTPRVALGMISKRSGSMTSPQLAVDLILFLDFGGSPLRLFLESFNTVLQAKPLLIIDFGSSPIFLQLLFSLFWIVLLKVIILKNQGLCW